MNQYTIVDLADISKFMKKERNKKNWTQEVLADMSAVSKATISRLESDDAGMFRYSLETLKRIMKVLGSDLKLSFSPLERSDLPEKKRTVMATLEDGRILKAVYKNKRWYEVNRTNHLEKKVIDWYYIIEKY